MSVRQTLQSLGFAPNLGNALAASFKNFDVPPAEFFTRTGGVLSITLDFSELQFRDHCAILPIAFDYKSSIGESCGGGTYNVAMSKSQPVVQAYLAATR